MGPLQLATFCINEGRLAAEAGQPSSACPYTRDRPYSRKAWVVGWTGTRRRLGKPLASNHIAEQNAELD